MQAGSIYNIQLGNYHDKYLCVFSGTGGYNLRRVRTPKSKIDGIRLPEAISISYSCTPLSKPSKKRK